MSRNLSDTISRAKPSALRDAEDLIAYFKAATQSQPKPAPSLTPLELMYAYYDAA